MKETNGEVHTVDKDTPGIECHQILTPYTLVQDCGSWYTRDVKGLVSGLNVSELEPRVSLSPRCLLSCVASLQQIRGKAIESLRPE